MTAVELTRFRRNLILSVLCAAQFMLILDIAIVNVALPSMQRTLGFSSESLQWVVAGYALTFGGFLMLGGRLADVVGRRRMFVTGLVLFIGIDIGRIQPVRRNTDRRSRDPGLCRRLGLASGVVASDNDL